MRAGPPTASTRPATASTRAGGPVVLDRYRLERQLGSGGFGTVWLARDERLERDVAVKILPRVRVNPGRFEREARAAARLSHPAIVTLYEAAADDEGAYLVSELVRGPTLERALDAGRLSDRSILAIGIELCDGLAHAHGEGVVHRDVKPSNILLPARASGQAAKLTDFGIARVVGGDTLTRTGELVGTAAYMAPEQAAGRDAAEPADLYSLALVLYEALTGINPGAHLEPRRRLAFYVPPLRRQRRELPRELGQAIDLALRPRAGERGTLAELRAGLEAALERVDDTPGVVAPPRLGEKPSRSGKISQLPLEEGGRDARRAQRVRQPVALPARAIAALTAAGVTAWVCAHILAMPQPAAPAAAAALAVALLPRLGWLALTAAAAVALTLQHHPGDALLIAALALPQVILLPRAGTLWPLPLLAPALNLAVGLGGAWPALAARASTTWRRAALGALGWAAFEVVHDGRNPWAGSLKATISHVLHPLASPRILAMVGVWALAAALLPLIGTSRSRAAGILAVAAWVAGLVAATAALMPGEATMAAVGATVGVLAALVPPKG
ncbi:MAG TPA: serine/threonine-protein kinase [Solirubrobacteraceae bacterium]|nr:serine/threonine-protein kinase [Solirubrobacteraceae bacterium]